MAQNQHFIIALDTNESQQNQSPPHGDSKRLIRIPFYLLHFFNFSRHSSHGDAEQDSG